MDKKQLINKIIQTTSVVEFYKLKEKILEMLRPAGEAKPNKKDREVD